jgi:ribosomal-protein-alanine N-acetyltransferase
MAFLRPTPSIDPDADIRGPRVYLRYPTMQDYGAWAELRALSRQHLTPWEPQWARDELTRSSFRRRLRQTQREVRDDLGYAYLIFGETPLTLLGGLNISNVRRGVAQTASLGYWIGAPYAGRGLMTEAVRAASVFAFSSLRLNRLEPPACHQRRIGAGADESGVHTRRACPAIPQDRRQVAGSRPLRPAA